MSGSLDIRLENVPISHDSRNQQQEPAKQPIAVGYLAVPLALRFYPERKQVRPEDHKLFDSWDEEADDDNESAAESVPAKTRISTRRERDRRHVWIEEGKWLRAVEVRTGMSDYKYTELVSGDLKEGQSLVTGVK